MPPLNNTQVVGVVHLFATDGLPPEFHTSRALSIEDTSFRAIHEREYGDVVDSDISLELTRDQLDELDKVVRDADLRPIAPITDECTGTQTYSVRLTFADSTATSLYQDSRTFGGEPGRCRNYNVEGDLAAVVNYLLDLEASV